jgi:hypothetical protein
MWSVAAWLGWSGSELAWPARVAQAIRGREIRNCRSAQQKAEPRTNGALEPEGRKRPARDDRENSRFSRLARRRAECRESARLDALDYYLVKTGPPMNQPNMLDQFLVNKNMAIGDAPIKVDPTTVQVFKLPAMVTPSRSHLLCQRLSRL